MNKPFVDSVNRRIKSFGKNFDFERDEKIYDVLSFNVGKNRNEITDYHISFIDLFNKNTKIQKSEEKFTNLLGKQKYYRQYISNGYRYSRRELRLPEDNSSEWQLLYETTVNFLEESGPILHLYYDGWKVARYKIYYWDERNYYDISKEKELIIAKKQLPEVESKIAELGYELPSEMDDDSILKIKNIVDNYPDYIHDL